MWGGGMMLSVKDLVYDETCKSCLFYHLCAGIELPHCDGKDYVKQLGGPIEVE